MALSFTLSHGRVWGRAAFALLLVLAALSATAEDGGLFAGLGGSWSGGGTISLANGARERLRCRAAYDAGARSLQLNIRCASDSYNIDLRGSLASRGGGAIAGSWSESSRNLSGSISGQASPGQITAVARGPSFSASISVSTHGNRQSVSISPSSSDIRGVVLALARQ